MLKPGRNFIIWNALISGIFFLTTSCERAIDLIPPDASEKLVVEAVIEQDMPPKVVLTRSLGYFKAISPEILVNSFVRDAQVEVSDGISSIILEEFADTLAPGLILFHYSVDTAASDFRGLQGKEYSLRITVENQLYTATTTIPPLRKTMDSIWWKPAPDSTTGKVIVMGRFTDPPGYGNYIRYFTQRNNEPFYPGLSSVFDDQVVDGQIYNFQVDRGINRNMEFDFEDFAFFDRGDTVIVKFCNIDKATYDFWRTLEYSYSSIGSPFSTPTRVMGNISGGALGYFGGYSVQYRSLQVPF